MFRQVFGWAILTTFKPLFSGRPLPCAQYLKSPPTLVRVVPIYSSQLLRVEPSERMTLEDAARHPWLRDAVAEASSAKASGGAKAASSNSG